MYVELTPQQHRVQYMMTSTVASRDFRSTCDRAFVQRADRPDRLTSVPCSPLPLRTADRSHGGSSSGADGAADGAAAVSTPTTRSVVVSSKWSIITAFVGGVIVGWGVVLSVRRRRQVPLLTTLHSSHSTPKEDEAGNELAVSRSRQ